MGVGGFGSFVKYSMFLFNAVILVAGCGLVGFGIYTRTNTSGVTKFSSILGSNLLPTVSLILIITGSIIILLSFLGCCGAIKEVKCMLVTFFMLLLLMFVAFLVGGILVYAFQDKIEEATLKQLRSQLANSYGKKGEESVTEGWDYMQKLFKCCGISGGVNSTQSWAFYKMYTNWYADKSTPLFHQIETVPVSCCKDSINTPNITKCQGLGAENANKMPVIGPPVNARSMNDQLYTQGCYDSFNAMIHENLNIFIFVGIGIVVAMILGMVFSLCLCRRIKDDDYYDCD